MHTYIITFFADTLGKTLTIDIEASNTLEALKTFNRWNKDSPHKNTIETVERVTNV